MAFTLAQIDALVSAGYDLQEILAVNGPVENPAPADGNKAILDAITNLTQVIQNGNIRMGGFPAPVTPDDPGQILANIINPPAKNWKK